jgi:DNA-binding transcriptional regulator GbsR (MarR family)
MKLEEKVEKMGVMLEQMGYAPVPGRIVIYLLLSEPPYRDFYQIREFLKASKSTVSNTLNLLIQQGVVNYITFSGNRKRYFQIDTNGLLKIIKEQHRQGALFNDMMKETLQERKGSEFKEFNQGLKEVVDFSAYLHRGIEQLIAEWDKGRR